MKTGKLKVRLRKPLNKSYVERVASKMTIIFRCITEIMLWSVMPGSWRREPGTSALASPGSLPYGTFPPEKVPSRGRVESILEFLK
jgi:hypothetical protein